MAGSARRGGDATLVFRGGRPVAESPVEPVARIRDLTGAGDAFNAGFLRSLLSGAGDLRERDLVRHCLAGHALAARVLARPGASEPAEAAPGR